MEKSRKQDGWWLKQGDGMGWIDDKRNERNEKERREMEDHGLRPR
jgi:hypothetical protein